MHLVSRLLADVCSNIIAFMEAVSQQASGLYTVYGCQVALFILFQLVSSLYKWMESSKTNLIDICIGGYSCSI